MVVVVSLGEQQPAGAVGMGRLFDEGGRVALAGVIQNPGALPRGIGMAL